jgi:hypothetical protein
MTATRKVELTRLTRDLAISLVDSKLMNDGIAPYSKLVEQRDKLAHALQRGDTILRGMDPQGLYAQGVGAEVTALLLEVSDQERS